MKFMIAAVCLLAFSQSALAQGVSNKRDVYGNLVRDGDNASRGGVNQSTPTPGGAIRNTPVQPAINAAKTTRTAR
ncbi:MAG: hypothetical protein J0H40_00130 [Rhizobiales bacterium]|nr:hypothetical protein [Hyphomicrobiales bacterium]